MSDNNVNSTDNGNNKKSTYFADSQKRYGEKCVKDGYLSEWDVVLNTMCDGVDNFM